MRLWLRDSERRPDPAPVQTDDRTPLAIGIAAWLIAFVVFLIVRAVGVQVADAGTIVWTCIAGLVLGAVGLIYAARAGR